MICSLHADPCVGRWDSEHRRSAAGFADQGFVERDSSVLEQVVAGCDRFVVGVLDLYLDDLERFAPVSRAGEHVA